MVWNAWPMTVSGIVSPERMKETVVSMAPQMPPPALSLTRVPHSNPIAVYMSAVGRMTAMPTTTRALMVTSPLSAVSVCHSSWRASTSSPTVGSSRNRIFGLVINPIAMLKRRCMPPESVWARWCATWSKPNWVSMAIVVLSPRR